MDKIKYFQSGIGAGDDLKVYKPTGPSLSEKFKYSSAIKGTKEEKISVYKEKSFQYRFLATGKENLWVPGTNILFNLKYYPKQTAEGVLTGQYFDPKEFSYQPSAKTSYYTADDYEVDLVYQLFAYGHKHKAQEALKYKIQVTVNFQKSNGTSGQGEVINPTWLSGTVTTENYNYETTRALSSNSVQAEITPHVVNYIQSVGDVVAYSVTNHKIILEKPQQFGATINNPNLPARGFTRDLGEIVIASDGIQRTRELDTSFVDEDKKIETSTIQSLLTNAVQNKGMQVQYYYISSSHPMVSCYHNNNGEIFAGLRGVPNTGKSQILFEYLVYTKIYYIDSLGLAQTDESVVSPIRIAATTQRQLDNAISRKTPRDIMAPFISEWKATNRISQVNNVEYYVRPLNVIESIVFTLPASKVRK